MPQALAKPTLRPSTSTTYPTRRAAVMSLCHRAPSSGAGRNIEPVIVNHLQPRLRIYRLPGNHRHVSSDAAREPPSGLRDLSYAASTESSRHCNAHLNAIERRSWALGFLMVRMLLINAITFREARSKFTKPHLNQGAKLLY